MAVHIEPVGDRGPIRAFIPDPGPDGRRCVGYALPIEAGRWLVRLPGAIARRVDGRLDAIAALRGETTPT